MAKKVITEADVSRMEVPGELVLTRDVVITPSALDTAFSKGLKVIYQRSDPPSFQDGMTEKEKVLLRKISSLGDGNYLLQVRSGRLRLFEIGEDGVSPVPGS